MGTIISAIRATYAWVAAKLWAAELDDPCEHQAFTKCEDCFAMDTADRFC